MVRYGIVIFNICSCADSCSFLSSIILFQKHSTILIKDQSYLKDVPAIHQREDEEYLLVDTTPASTAEYS